MSEGQRERLERFLRRHGEHGGTFATDVAPPVLRLDCGQCVQNIQIPLAALAARDEPEPSCEELRERLEAEQREHGRTLRALEGAVRRPRTPDPQPDAERERDSVMQDDIAELLRILGLGDHARPCSPHEIVQQEVIPAVRALAAPARREPKKLAVALCTDELVEVAAKCAYEQGSDKEAHHWEDSDYQEAWMDDMRPIVWDVCRHIAARLRCPTGLHITSHGVRRCIAEQAAGTHETLADHGLMADRPTDDSEREVEGGELDAAFDATSDNMKRDDA